MADILEMINRNSNSKILQLLLQWIVHHRSGGTITSCVKLHTTNHE